MLHALIRLARFALWLLMLAGGFVASASFVAMSNDRPDYFGVAVMFVGLLVAAGAFVIDAELKRRLGEAGSQRRGFEVVMKSQEGVRDE